MQHYQVTATYNNGVTIRRIVVADSTVTAIQRFVTVCTNFGITLPEPVYTIDVEPVPTPSGDWNERAYQEELALMEQYNVYLHVITRQATSANLENAGLIDDEMTAEDFYKFRHDLATDDTGMNEPEWVVQVYESL